MDSTLTHSARSYLSSSLSYIDVDEVAVGKSLADLTRPGAQEDRMLGSYDRLDLHVSVEELVAGGYVDGEVESL